MDCTTRFCAFTPPICFCLCELPLYSTAPPLNFGLSPLPPLPSSLLPCISDTSLHEIAACEALPTPPASPTDPFVDLSLPSRPATRVSIQLPEQRDLDEGTDAQVWLEDRANGAAFGCKGHPRGGENGRHVLQGSVLSNSDRCACQK